MERMERALWSFGAPQDTSKINGVIDGAEFYHVGASIKDAGKRAFMISRMQDQPNIDNVKQYIDRAWTGGKVLQP